jgi:hypothetical protein
MEGAGCAPVKDQASIGDATSSDIRALAGPHCESLSREIFGIDWDAHLPLDLEGGIQLELATLDEALAFAATHYAAIFGSSASDHRFFAEAHTPARERFLRMSDRFVFREGSRVVGLLIGQPTDWSTYYWRSVALLPERQGRGLLAAALARTDAVMRESGVVRIEGETAPNNYRQLRLLLRLGYCVTGSVNSERWGTMLRLTKYLEPSAEQCFTNQFCRDPLRPTFGSFLTTLTHEGGRHEEVRNRNALSGVPTTPRTVRA